jgi:hypothetical protein
MNLRPRRQGGTLSCSRDRIQSLVQNRRRPIPWLVLPPHCQRLSGPIPTRAACVRAREFCRASLYRGRAKPPAAPQRRLAQKIAPERKHCQKRHLVEVWDYGSARPAGAGGRGTRRPLPGRRARFGRPGKSHNSAAGNGPFSIALRCRRRSSWPRDRHCGRYGPRGQSFFDDITARRARR